MCGEIIPEGSMICQRCEKDTPDTGVSKIMVNINKITDIAKFSNLISKCTDDVIIRSGRFAINAKSIMAIFSLDLTKPVMVEFYGHIPYEVAEGMKKFIVG